MNPGGGLLSGHVALVTGALLFASGHGSVINIASIYGLVASRSPMAAYNSTKGALVSLTRHLAAQWGPRRVRVTALAPGYFPTELTGMLADPDFVTDIESQTLLGRAPSIDELDGPLLFLASGASSYVTGQTLAVDGAGPAPERPPTQDGAAVGLAGPAGRFCWRQRGLAPGGHAHETGRRPAARRRHALASSGALRRSDPREEVLHHPPVPGYDRGPEAAGDGVVQLHDGGVEQRARRALEKQFAGQPEAATGAQQHDVRGVVTDLPAEHMPL